MMQVLEMGNSDGKEKEARATSTKIGHDSKKYVDESEEKYASGDYVVVMLEVDAILLRVNQLSVNYKDLIKEHLHYQQTFQQ